jgi:hypothetical protein
VNITQIIIDGDRVRTELIKTTTKSYSVDLSGLGRAGSSVRWIKMQGKNEK